LHYKKRSAVRFIHSAFRPYPVGWICSLKIFILFFILFCWILSVDAQAPETGQPSLKKEGPYRVAILPVTVHSPENLAFMKEGLLDMLASRMHLEGRVSVMEKGRVKKALAEVEGELDVQKAQEVGARLGADYVVFGSLTKLGDSASLDLKVVSVRGEKPPASVYVQAKRIEEVINGVDEVARQADEKILGYSLLPPTAQKPAEKQPTAAISPAAPVRAPAAPAMMGTGMYTADFNQSPPLPLKVRGMVVADFDGDGRKEIALIDERSLRIYRWENELRLLKRIDGNRLDQFLAVDAADLDKDGKAEIYVTSFPADPFQPGDRLFSFVVAFKDGEFKIAASEIDWFLRVVDWPGKGPVLLGQAKEKGKSFHGPIYEMTWDGKRVKEGRSIEGPKLFNVYGFAPFLQKGNLHYAFIDADYRLKVSDPKGNFIWKSNNYYASDISFKTSHLKTYAGSIDQGDEFSSVNVRIAVEGEEIVLIRNSSPVGDLFKRAKYFSGGEIQSLAWGGAMFQERWKTKEISGYVVDFAIQDMGGGSGKVLIAAVNLPKESVLSSSTNSALLISRFQ